MLKRLFGTSMLVTLFLCQAVPSHSQNILDPSSKPGPFVLQATLTSSNPADDEFGRRVALAADVALVSGTGLVYVFERDTTADTWHEAESITPPAGAEDFGRALAIDRSTAIIGSRGASHLFRRGPRGGWREVATLLPNDGNPNFGVAVDIAGNGAIVGAPRTLASETGAAYIYTRWTQSSGWQQTALLHSPASIGRGPVTFGSGVGISGDAAIVSEVTGVNGGAANIFVRDAGNAEWRAVHRQDIAGTTFVGDVDLERRTAVFGGGEDISFAPILGRDAAGSWAAESSYVSPDVCCGTFDSVEVSGDRIILGLSRHGTGVDVLARNQGGRDAWQRIARFRPPTFRPADDSGLGRGVAMSGDTALLGAPGRSGTTSPDDNVVFVIVSDLDGDGMRDGLDPCVRDPLNNVAGGCQRASGSHPTQDHLITQGEVTTERRGQQFLITATFTNTSAIAVGNPFFEITELTGGNRLIDADGGPGGVGATLSLDVGDGVLSPGEAMTVTFRIRLDAPEPFVFRVTLHGDGA